MRPKIAIDDRANYKVRMAHRMIDMMMQNADRKEITEMVMHEFPLADPWLCAEAGAFAIDYMDRTEGWMATVRNDRSGELIKTLLRAS